MTRFAALVAVTAVSPVLAADPPKLPGPKIDFPDVPGFTLRKPTVFPEARLGYSIGYSAEGVAVTVYVYDNDRTDITDGARSAAVKAEMAPTVAAIEFYRKEGKYKSVKDLGEDVIRLGGEGTPEALRRRFEIDVAASGPAVSEAYLTGYKGHFVKVRVSYDAADKDAASRLVTKALAAIGGALK